MAFQMPSRKIQQEADPKFKILVYGESGIGKTTFASKFPNTLFLATEMGQGFIDGFEPIPVETWEAFVSVITNIQVLAAKNQLFFADEEKTPVQTICVDTIDVLYVMCEKYACQQLGIKDLQDADWGKGWRTVTRLFNQALTMIDFIPLTRIFLAHTQEKQVGKTMKATTALADRVRNNVHAFCDIVLYVQMKRVQDPNNPARAILKRIATAQPTTLCYAKDRTGMLPNTFELDYDVFMDCFQNESDSDDE